MLCVFDYSRYETVVDEVNIYTIMALIWRKPYVRADRVFRTALLAAVYGVT